MKYYSIQHSLDKKIMGNDPQVKEVIYHCSVNNEPRFIGKFHFEEIKVEPIIANPVLYSKSKLTDLIYLWNIGFNYVKLISGKLKSILEKQRTSGLQFIQCSVFKDGVEYSDYWLLNMFESNNEFIDFEKSKIIVGVKKDEGGTYQKTEIVSSVSEFDSLVEFHKQKMEIVKAENIYLKDDITKDFFMLKNSIKYMVSEKLKQEIEDAGCTGIEFQPSELAITEWLQGGEREKIYGKA